MEYVKMTFQIDRKIHFLGIRANYLGLEPKNLNVSTNLCIIYKQLCTICKKKMQTFNIYGFWTTSQHFKIRNSDQQYNIDFNKAFFTLTKENRIFFTIIFINQPNRQILCD